MLGPLAKPKVLYMVLPIRDDISQERRERVIDGIIGGRCPAVPDNDTSDEEYGLLRETLWRIILPHMAASTTENQSSTEVAAAAIHVDLSLAVSRETPVGPARTPEGMDRVICLVRSIRSMHFEPIVVSNGLLREPMRL